MTDLGNGLIAISVPEDAKDFEITNSTIGVGSKEEYICSEMWCKIENFRQRVFENKGDHFEILGTVTKDTTSFDVSPYVERLKDTPSLFKNYFDDSFPMPGPKSSFKTIIFSKGLFFENPYQEPYNNGLNCQYYNAAYDKWQQAENNLVQKLVILKRI